MKKAKKEKVKLPMSLTKKIVITLLSVAAAALAVYLIYYFTYFVGYDRYEELYRVLIEKGGIVKDEKEAMEVLSSVGRRNWNNDDSNSVTVHSAVYNLTEKSVYWVSNENWDEESAIFKYSLAE